MLSTHGSIHRDHLEMIPLDNCATEPFDSEKWRLPLTSFSFMNW